MTLAGMQLMSGWISRRDVSMVRAVVLEFERCISLLYFNGRALFKLKASFSILGSYYTRID
jgi:hypothetical protein